MSKPSPSSDSGAGDTLGLTRDRDLLALSHSSVAILSPSQLAPGTSVLDQLRLLFMLRPDSKDLICYWLKTGCLVKQKIQVVNSALRKVVRLRNEQTNPTLERRSSRKNKRYKGASNG